MRSTGELKAWPMDDDGETWQRIQTLVEQMNNWSDFADQQGKTGETV